MYDNTSKSNKYTVMNTRFNLTKKPKKATLLP